MTQQARVKKRLCGISRRDDRLAELEPCRNVALVLQQVQRGGKMNELLERGVPVAQLVHEAGINLPYNVFNFLVGRNDAAAQLAELRARDFVVGAGGGRVRQR